MITRNVRSAKGICTFLIFCLGLFQVMDAKAAKVDSHANSVTEFEAAALRLRQAEDAKVHVLKATELEYQLLYFKTKMDYHADYEKSAFAGDDFGLSHARKLMASNNGIVKHPLDKGTHGNHVKQITLAVGLSLPLTSIRYIASLNQLNQNDKIARLTEIVQNTYLADLGIRLRVLWLLFQELPETDKSQAFQVYQSSNLRLKREEIRAILAAIDPEAGKQLTELLNQLNNDDLQLKYEIKQDVLQMNLHDEERKGLSLRQYAGSFSYDEQMYPPEARVHYFFLVEDIPKRNAGYYHHQPIQPAMFDRGADHLQEFSALLTEVFDKGNRTFSSVWTVRGHHCAFAIQNDGRIVVVDSSTGLSCAPSEDQERNLIEAANRARIRSDEKGTVVFNKVEYIPAGQQVADQNCLFFGMLNAHQIAKKGDIQSYKEVSASLASGELRTYEDIRRIGEHVNLAQRATTNLPYREFMQAIRAKTRELINELIGSAEEEKAPTAPKNASGAGDLENKGMSEEGSPEKDTRSETLRLLAGKPYGVVSQANCRLREGFLSRCNLKPLELVEERKLLQSLSYQTTVTFTRPRACGDENNRGVLKATAYSVTGEFVLTRDLDYRHETFNSVRLPDGGPIGRLTIEPRSPTFFASNRYPAGCEIIVTVVLNTADQDEAKRAAARSESELKRSRDHFERLATLNKFQMNQQKLKALFDSFFEKVSAKQGGRSPLLAINPEFFEAVVKDSTGQFDERIKGLFRHLIKIIEDLKKQQDSLQNRSVSDLLTEEERKLLAELAQDGKHDPCSNSLDEAQAELCRKTQEHQLVLGQLEPLLNPKTQQELLEQDLRRILHDEINGPEGLVARIEARFARGR